MRLTLKAKLIGTFTLLITLSSISGGISYYKFTELMQAQSDLAAASNRINRSADLEEAITTSLRNEKNAILAFTQKDTEEFAAAVLESRKTFLKAKDDLLALASEAGKRHLETVGAKFNRMSEIQDETIRNAKLNSSNRAVALWEADGAPAKKDLETEFEATLVKLDAMQSAAAAKAQKALLSARASVSGAVSHSQDVDPGVIRARPRAGVEGLCRQPGRGAGRGRCSRCSRWRERPARLDDRDAVRPAGRRFHEHGRCPEGRRAPQGQCPYDG